MKTLEKFTEKNPQVLQPTELQVLKGGARRKVKRAGCSLRRRRRASGG